MSVAINNEGIKLAQQAVVVRFAGDSGDGIQVTGSEFANTTALAGRGLTTFPDFPAEIRAPRGTLFGVSAFQIQFGDHSVYTPGDAADVLVVFNPAALKTNLANLKRGGLIIADRGAFEARNLQKAGYPNNPLDDQSLSDYRVWDLDITKRTLDALATLTVGKKQATRARNLWVLGLLYWLFEESRSATVEWIEQRFTHDAEVVAANLAALHAGHAFGETSELDAPSLVSPAAAMDMPAGTYRSVTGTDAMALGLAAVASLSKTTVAYCSYPITPASALLHQLAKLNAHGITTFQAEDEIAAASAALGASYAGHIGVTASSGPGIALKTEVLGLAVAAELPLIVIDVQRAGPSTGMPTKAEQGDLFLAVLGRHGEAPLCVLAPEDPVDCFHIMLDAARIATRFMTPVMVLSDAYIANAAEPWKIPGDDELMDIEISPPATAQEVLFSRDEASLARRWTPAGTAGLQHRIGGLERSGQTGHISYDPANHQAMTKLRDRKIATIAEFMPAQQITTGDPSGDAVLIGWGSTYGVLRTVTERLNRHPNLHIGHIQLRQLWPLPRGLSDLLAGYRCVIVVENNLGQLRSLVRDQFLIPAVGINQISGQPFKVTELEQQILDRLEQPV